MNGNTPSSLSLLSTHALKHAYVDFLTLELYQILLIALCVKRRAQQNVKILKKTTWFN